MVGNQVRTIDVAPTILEALQVPVRSRMEGESLMDLMRGEEESAPRIAYADALRPVRAGSFIDHETFMNGM